MSMIPTATAISDCHQRLPSLNALLTLIVDRCEPVSKCVTRVFNIYVTSFTCPGQAVFIMKLFSLFVGRSRLQVFEFIDLTMGDKWLFIRTALAAVLLAYFTNKKLDVTKTDVCYPVHIQSRVSEILCSINELQNSEYIAPHIPSGTCPLFQRAL